MLPVETSYVILQRREERAQLDFVLDAGRRFDARRHVDRVRAAPPPSRSCTFSGVSPPDRITGRSRAAAAATVQSMTRPVPPRRDGIVRVEQHGDPSAADPAPPTG